MSNKHGKGPKVELKLKLNLSPPRGSGQEEQQPCVASPQRSCLTTEMEEGGGLVGYPAGAPEESPTSTMVLVGCPRCLMYVMLSEKEARCPRCKSTALLEFLSNPGKKVAAAPSNKRIRRH